MKTTRALISLMAALLLIPTLSLAQTKMTYQQYQSQLEQFKQREQTARKKISDLNVENNNLQKQLDDLDTEIGQEWQSIYKDLGIDPTELRSFADELDAIGAALDGYEAMSADDLKNNRAGLDALQKRIDAVAGNRAAVLSRYKTIIARLNTRVADLKSGKVKAKPVMAATPVATKAGPAMTSTPKSREIAGGTPTKKGTMYTVVRGDYLWKIAAMKQHYGDGMKWMRIYSVNRDQIKNPDLIYPKQRFYIPFEVNANQVLVKKGQNLSSLAEELYGDPFQWRKLYEANKGLITDPTTIYPEMILTVPGR